MAVSPKALIDKLNTTCNKAILQAVALCLSRTHFYVELEHWLLKLLERPTTTSRSSSGSTPSTPTR